MAKAVEFLNKREMVRRLTGDIVKSFGSESPSWTLRVRASRKSASKYIGLTMEHAGEPWKLRVSDHILEHGDFDDAVVLHGRRRGAKRVVPLSEYRRAVREGVEKLRAAGGRP